MWMDKRGRRQVRLGQQIGCWGLCEKYRNCPFRRVCLTHEEFAFGAVSCVLSVPVKQKIRPVAGVNLLRVPDPAICAPSTTQTAALPHRPTFLSTMFRPHGSGVLTPSRNCGIASISRSTSGTCAWFRPLLRNDSLPSASGNGAHRSVRLGPSRTHKHQGRARCWQCRE